MVSEVGALSPDKQAGGNHEFILLWIVFITIPIRRTLSPASQSKYGRKSYTLTIETTPSKYLFLPLSLMRQVMRKYAAIRINGHPRPINPIHFCKHFRRLHLVALNWCGYPQGTRVLN